MDKKLLIILGVVIIILAAIGYTQRDALPFATQVSPTAHPRLFFTASDVPGLRAKTTDTDVGSVGIAPATIWAGVKSNADTYAAEGNVQYIGSSWRHEEERLLTLSFAYTMTGDQTYFNSAKSSVMAALNFQTWPSYQNPPGGPLFYYFGKMSLCRGVTYFYDMCYADLTSSERTQINNKLTTECVDFYGPDAGYAAYNQGANSFFAAYAPMVNNNNFGVNIRSVYAVVFAGVDGISDMPERRNVNNVLTMQILDGIGETGGWREGLQYGTSAAEWMTPGLMASDHVFGTDYASNEGLNNLIRFPYYNILPEGHGNTNFGEVLHSSTQVFSVLNAYLNGQNDNTLASRQIREFGIGGSYKPLSFINYDQHIAPVAVDQFPTSWNFDNVAWQSMRSGWNNYDTLLATKINWKDVNHGSQNDCNHYVLITGDNWLAADGGKHISSGYLGSTGAHNTLIVDNVDDSQTHWEADGDHCYVTGWLGTEFYDFVSGEASDVYEEVGNRDDTLDFYERSFVFVKPNYLVIYDDVKTDGNNRNLKIVHHLRGLPGAIPATQKFVRQGSQIKLRTNENENEAGVIYNVLEPENFNFNIVTTHPEEGDLENFGHLGPYMEISQPYAMQTAEFLSVLDIQSSPRAAGIIREAKVPGASNMAVGDFDNDGVDEVAYNRFNTMRIYDEGNTLIPGGSCHGPVAAGDVDGDGIDEIVCPDNVWEYSGNSYVVKYTLGHAGAEAIATLDVDNDGVDEIIVADGASLMIFDDGVSFATTNIGTRANDMDVGDVTGDGSEEIVITQGNTIRVLTTTANVISTVATGSTSSCGSIGVGNLDFDVREEIVCDHQIYKVSGTAINLEDEITSYALNKIFVHDVDGSGRDDIVKTGSQSTWSMVDIWDKGYDGYRKETTTGGYSDQTLGSSYYNIVAGDVDGDGVEEFMIGSDSEGMMWILSVLNYGEPNLDTPNAGGFANALQVTKLEGTDYIGANVVDGNNVDTHLFNRGTGIITGNGATCNAKNCMVRKTSGFVTMYALTRGQTLSDSTTGTLATLSNPGSLAANTYTNKMEVNVNVPDDTIVSFYTFVQPNHVLVGEAIKQFTYANNLVTLQGMSGEQRIIVSAEFPDPCLLESCGNGVCRSECGETQGSCTQDCDSCYGVVCGDNVCNQICESSNSCPADCEVVEPPKPPVEANNLLLIMGGIILVLAVGVLIYSVIIRNKK